MTVPMEAEPDASIVRRKVNYSNARLNIPSGDRFEAIQLFEGASILDPRAVKSIRQHEAMTKLEKLRCYHVLNKEGPENIVNRLNLDYSAFRQNVMRIPQEFDYKKDKAAILSWYYKLFLKLGEEVREDTRAQKSCRYCTADIMVQSANATVT